jgi:AcrR family transcriptional regulator
MLYAPRVSSPRTGRRRKARETYHHGDLRRALLAAALRLAQKKGVDALSLREVARAAGVSHAAPYAHFADKAALIGALKANGFTLLGQALVEALAGAPSDPRARLLALAGAYVRFASEHAAFFQLMFRKRLERTPFSHKYIEPGLELFALLEGHMAKLVRDGAPSREASLLALCMLHGLTSLWIDGPLEHLAGGVRVDDLALQLTGDLLDLISRRRHA